MVYLIPQEPTLHRYKLAAQYLWYWKTMGSSLLYSATLMILQVVMCSMVGYGFARFNFPFKKVLFACVVVMIVIPTNTIMLPLYTTFTRFDVFGIIQAGVREKRAADNTNNRSKNNITDTKDYCKSKHRDDKALGIAYPAQSVVGKLGVVLHSLNACPDAVNRGYYFLLIHLFSPFLVIVERSFLYQSTDNYQDQTGDHRGHQTEYGTQSVIHRRAEGRIVGQFDHV